MKNKKYIEPEMELTMFDSQDIITTSGGTELPGIELPDDEW